jgi:hypothetical protein
VVKFAFLPCRCCANIQGCESQESPCHALGVSHTQLTPHLTQAKMRVFRTWVLTSEPVLEPPELLREECEKVGLGEDEFLVPALGETVLF